jgi:hypothetical protein
MTNLGGNPNSTGDPNSGAAARFVVNERPNADPNAVNAGAQRLLEVFLPKTNTVEAAGVDETSDDTSASAKPSADLDKDAASDLVTKICGNAGILINQLLPSNFNNFWDAFENSSPPVFKDKFLNKNEDTIALKRALFDKVVQRDNIGESTWLLYTGILVSCIVQFQLASFNCKAGK